MLIGVASGIIGIIIASLLTMPVNMAIEQTANIANVAGLTPFHMIALLLGSVALTLVAGFVPARIAAKKDPVTALRTE